MIDQRVLLVAGDEDGGCGHYRMREPARVAAAAGVDVRVDTAVPVEAEVGRDGRLRVERLEADYDVIVIQRPSLGLFHQLIPHLRDRGVAIAVELDDDIAAVHAGNVSSSAFDPRHSPHSNWQHILRACDMADLVIASTPAIARRYGTSRGVRAVVARNLVAEADLARPKERAERPRLGWTGTVQTHPEDLDVVGPHLKAAM